MPDRITRRRALHQAAGAALAGIAGVTPSRGQEATARPPNILFILADDLGYGDLGCYGQEFIRTPNIDRLAQEGMRFTSAYAGSTVCAPSRCCLMTGLHTGHAFVRGNARVPLRPEDVTVAEVLRDAGYVTGVIGKWGLGEPGTTGIPTRQGFDEWFGYLNQQHAHNYYPEYLWRGEQQIALRGNTADQRRHYSHDAFTGEALDFITRHADSSFFLYLAYTIPHANNELGAETGDGMEVPSYGHYADRDWPSPQKGHAAMIDRLDDHVGQIMARLSKLGLDEDTLVIFSSDNGPHKEGGADPGFFRSSGPLRGYKRALYEGGIRVPLIARWPRAIPEGGVTDHVCAFWDFLPTAAELCGGVSPEGLDGLSFAPTLLGADQPQHESLYWEFLEGGFSQAVRLGDWKGVRLERNGPIELYHLGDDIGETTDLAASRPEVVRHMAATMDEAHVDSAEFPIPT